VHKKLIYSKTIRRPFALHTLLQCMYLPRGDGKIDLYNYTDKMQLQHM